MRWEDERYVRLYTRDTTDWLCLSFLAQGLFCLLLRKVDRAGILELGRHGRKGVAVAVGHPGDWARLEPALEELLGDGSVKIDGTTLLIPNFIEAQEASMSDAARKREQRERARAGVTKRGRPGGHDGTTRDIPSQNVTDGHETGQKVTSGHAASRAVTPSLAEPSRAEPTASASAGARPPTPREQFEERWPSLLELTDALDASGLGRSLPNAPATRGALDQLVKRHGVPALVADVAACPEDKNLGWYARRWAAHDFRPPAVAHPPAPRPEPAPAGCDEWGRLREHLRTRLRPDLFDRWFAPLTGRRVNGALVLKAPAEPHRLFLADNYLGWLAAEAGSVLGSVTVEVE